MIIAKLPMVMRTRKMGERKRRWSKSRRLNALRKRYETYRETLKEFPPNAEGEHGSYEEDVVENGESYQKSVESLLEFFSPHNHNCKCVTYTKIPISTKMIY